jgi:hypothetical protein
MIFSILNIFCTDSGVWNLAPGPDQTRDLEAPRQTANTGMIEIRAAK